jgi:O-antigen/teichoic acid export membrane protein
MIESKVLLKTPEKSETRISGSLIAKGVISNWSYLILNIVVAFRMTPFVVHHLGNNAYGIWALVLQLTGYMGVVDVGLRSALVRFVSRFYARGEHDALNRLLNVTFKLYAAIAPVCFLVAIVLATIALPHMHIPDGMLRRAQMTVLIAGCCVVCDFVFATSHAALAGLSRWDLINVVWMPILLVRTFLIVVFLDLGFGILTLGFIQFSVTLVGYLIEMFILHRLLPGFWFKWEAIDRVHVRPMIKHGWYSFLLSIATKVNYQVDAVVISLFLPIEQVTFYVIGLRMIEYLRDLLTAMTMIVAPVVSSREALSDSPCFTEMLIRGTKYSLIVGFLGGVSLLGLGSDFIRLWMGPRFGQASGLVLMILAIGLIVSCTQFVSAQILFGISKHRVNLDWTVVESVLNLTFSVILVHWYGIFGVAAGTTLANLVVRAWFYPKAFLKTFEVPWRLFLKDAVMPAFGPACCFLAAILCCRWLFPIHNYSGLLVTIIAGGIACLPCLWFFGLDEVERTLISTKSLRYGLSHLPSRKK